MDNSEVSKKERLFTFSSGGWVILLSGFFCLVAAFLVLLPVFQTGFIRAIGDGKHVESYGFDLSNLSIPKGLLLASGKAKDEIRAVPVSLVETITPPEVELMNTNERYHYLIPSDRVIGVAINGEARAYPVRYMNLHEVLNDVLGDMPIAVTWSSLCDSAVVFDRRVAQPAGEKEIAPEFGVSGLIYQSNLVVFDRRSEAKNESLWVQLGFKAIAGPAVRKSLTLVPYELTTWSAWTAEHPNTRVFMGLRTLKGAYGDAQDPFNQYLTSDDLKFPVLPRWGHGQLKVPVVATSRDLQHWVVMGLSDSAASRPAMAAGTQAGGNVTRIHAFLFAWFAQHSTDTDYSAVAK